MTCALLIAVALAAPPQTHSPGARVVQLETALDAVRKADPAELGKAYQYASALERSACTSSVERLRVECLITAARKYCARRPKAEAAACAAEMDVVVSNVLAERQLVPTDHRLELMKRSKDWRKEMIREIRRIQGTLVVDFKLRNGGAESSNDLAIAINQFCLDTADQSNLSWQICAASLVWFVGAALPPEPTVATRKTE